MPPHILICMMIFCTIGSDIPGYPESACPTSGRFVFGLIGASSPFCNFCDSGTLQKVPLWRLACCEALLGNTVMILNGRTASQEKSFRPFEPCLLLLLLLLLPLKSGLAVTGCIPRLPGIPAIRSSEEETRG